MERHALVSSGLFAAQSLIALVEEEKRFKEIQPAKDAWQYAFDRVVSWYTLVLRIVMMMVFIFVVTLVVRISLVALLSSPASTTATVGNEHVKDAARDQMRYVLSFVMDKRFLRVFAVWAPMLLWMSALGYGFFFLRESVPVAYHAAHAFFVNAFALVMAFVCVVRVPK